MTIKVSRRIRRVGQGKTVQGGAGWPVVLAKMEPSTSRVSLVAGGFNAAASGVPREYLANSARIREAVGEEVCTPPLSNHWKKGKDFCRTYLGRDPCGATGLGWIGRSALWAIRASPELYEAKIQPFN
jgi:hypothetical protein